MAIRNIVILTGAGVSAESGLATFRGPDGLWEGHRVEDVATPEAFRRDPALVHAFYDARRARLGTVEPNAAHKALARLDAEWPGDLLLVTQNVDDLHERAGSRRLHRSGPRQATPALSSEQRGRSPITASCGATSSSSTAAFSTPSSSRPSPRRPRGVGLRPRTATRDPRHRPQGPDRWVVDRRGPVALVPRDLCRSGACPAARVDRSAVEHGLAEGEAGLAVDRGAARDRDS